MAQNATYLEEYLDDISSVPKEIKRNFNLMRELDQNTVVLQQEIATLRSCYLERAKSRLDAQNNVDTNKEESSGRGGKKLTAREKAKSNRNSKSKGGNDKKSGKDLAALVRDEKALEYIQKQHQKAMSNAEEKVAIAAQAYDLVDRAIRELDQKLQKFETELQQGKYAVHNIDENDANNENVYDGDDQLHSPAGPLKGLKRPRPGSSWEDLGYVQVLRGLPGLVPKPVTVSRKSSLATTSSILASNVSDRSSISANVNFVSNKANGIVAVPALSSSVVGVQPTRLVGEMPIDPNEPTYCFCNRVSFGEMVGCDNDDCEIEWFHYACVGLTEQPKGKWYCPQCEAIMAGAAQNKKKKGRR